MAIDYNTLSNWNNGDLVFRDSMLSASTRVMGMSQRAAILHVVALVCTSGTSLPINLAFCIWHGHRRVKVKKERKMIRQILGARNVVYQGSGKWVDVTPAPDPWAPAPAPPSTPPHADYWAYATGNPLEQGTGKPNAHYETGNQWEQGTGIPSVNVAGIPAARHRVHHMPPSTARWQQAYEHFERLPRRGHMMYETPNGGHHHGHHLGHGHHHGYAPHAPHYAVDQAQGQWMPGQGNSAYHQQAQWMPDQSIGNDIRSQVAQGIINAGASELQQDLGSSDPSDQAFGTVDLSTLF